MKNNIISSAADILEALQRLNTLPGGRMTLFATDREGRLCGSLTDGDIRRGLIAGVTLAEGVEKVMRRDCMAIRPGDSPYGVMTKARSRRIELLPVVNEEGIIIDIIDLSRTRTALPMEAVLMAGGKGERLRPLTLECPKPLLKVGGKAIIDYNVDELLSCGVEKVYVTVNYLRGQIEEHFRRHPYAGRVECIAEPQRLGTAGSLSLLPPLRQETLLLMNSDLLTDIDFEALYLRHAESGADITLGVVPYNVSIPFSILETEGNRVTGITEKPTFNYFAGAGVYIMKSQLIQLIPKGEYLDAPDFITELIRRGMRVEYFPIEGTWIDIGSPDDYRYANEVMAGRAAMQRR